MGTARARTSRARRCEVNLLAQPDADLWPPKAWRRRPLSDQALITDLTGTPTSQQVSPQLCSFANRCRKH